VGSKVTDIVRSSYQQPLRKN